MEIIKERAIRLNQAIHKSGLTYAELETMTGIAKSSIQRYATGRTQKIPIENSNLSIRAYSKSPIFRVKNDISAIFQYLIHKYL